MTSVQRSEKLINASASPSETWLNVKNLADTVANHISDPNDYGIQCRLLIDNVLPRLQEISSVIDEDVIAVIESIFLDGTPAVAFSELCTALTSDVDNLTAETIVGILARFVSDNGGGVTRLSRVISKAESPGLVSSLVHLPSRISNVLLTTSENALNTNPGIDETVYYGTLSNAIYLQPSTSDPQRDQFLSQLLGRLVVMNHGDTMISCFLSYSNAKKMVFLLQKAPQMCVEALTSALLNAKVTNRHNERLVRSVLVTFVGVSRASRDACIYRIPFRRPLFRRVKLSVRRLSKCVKAQNDVLLFKEALTTAGEMWSNEEFVLGADVQLQRQVTRLLLYYLQYSALTPVYNSDPNMSSIMMIIVQGVHLRLDETDLRLRRHAMIIGEAASRHARDPEPLVFERGELTSAQRKEKEMICDETTEDGGDSDFSEVARNVGNGITDDDYSDTDDDVTNDKLLEKLNNGRSLAMAIDDRGIHGGEKQSEVSNITREVNSADSPSEYYTWPRRDEDEDWQAEDDWSSLASYETNSDEERGKWKNISWSDEAALREKVSAPMSVARIVALLREMNSSDGGAVTVMAETALAALRFVGDRAERREGIDALRAGAVEICLEIGRLEVERYPDDVVLELREARERALVNVMRLDIGECGCTVVQNVVCGSSADISRRIEALTIISTAVHQQTEDQHHAYKTTVVQKSLTREPPLMEGLVSLFRLLVDGLCEGGGADFIVVEGRDCRVWAQALVTLATVARCGGMGNEGVWMRGELLDVVVNKVGCIDGDPVVRRSVALALGSVIDSMSDSELQDRLGDSIEIVALRHDDTAFITTKCIDWLQTARENDADIGVRRFATIALRKWATRAESLYERVS